MHAFVLVHQQTEMDEGSIREKKASRNGSTDHSLDGQTKDKPPVKAAMLQKDVSVSVCS